MHAHRDDLVVDALLVAHPHHADGARLDDRQRVDRLLAEHQRIERVAVVAERARDEAVVGRIVHGAVEHAIESQEAGLLVQLVLVLASLRDLDDDGEGLLDVRVVDVVSCQGCMRHLTSSTGGGMNGSSDSRRSAAHGRNRSGRPSAPSARGGSASDRERAPCRNRSTIA